MVWLRSVYSKGVISGLLLGIGFVVHQLWVLALVGGVLFIHLLQQKSASKHKYLSAWLAWTIKASFSVWWLWSTYPIQWLPVEIGDIQLLLIGLYWSTVSLWLGAGALLVVWVWHRLQTVQKLVEYPLALMTLPFIWVLGELFGSLAFSVFLIGPGGGINTSFGMGYSGYLLAEHELFIQFAKVAGGYGLSFLFGVLIVGLFSLATDLTRKAKLVAGVLLVIYLTSFIPVSMADEITAGYRVVTIDTNFESPLLLSAVGERQAATKLQAAVQVALELEPDYILLPEDSRYFNQQRSVGAIKSLFKLQHDNPQVILVDSGRVPYGESAVLQSFIYNGEDDAVARVQKRYLVPQGEYMPTIYQKFIGLFGYSSALELIAKGLSYEVGPLTSQRELADSVPGILFCFESFDPQGVRTIISEHPEAPFIAHLVSHAWFNEPYSLWHQLDNMSRVQALWNQRYIVTAGNKVSGKVYTPNGNIIIPNTLASDEYWSVREVVIPFKK